MINVPLLFGIPVSSPLVLLSSCPLLSCVHIYRASEATNSYDKHKHHDENKQGCASSHPDQDELSVQNLGPSYSVDIYKLASNDEVDAVAEELRNHPERLNYLCKTLKQTCLMVACCASSLMTGNCCCNALLFINLFSCFT